MEAWLLNIFSTVGLAKTGAQSGAVAFVYPAWLWLVLVWLIFWWLSGRFSAKDDLSEISANKQLRVKHALIHKMQRVRSAANQSTMSLRTLLFNGLRGLILLCLAVALAQPVQKISSPTQPEPKTVRDIVFVIESSASFLIPDYEINGRQETRMNVVKNVLDQFIGELEGNRFSLAIYADKAFTLLPLTSDQTLARLTLKRLKPYLAGRTDTAMGEALGLALRQTDESTGITQANADTKKRVLVLISDGLSQPSRIELTEAVNYAQLLDVPIYTIGVGANSEKADKRVYTGLLYQPLEAESLRSIAEQTKGQYFQVGSGKQISQVLEKINQAEGVPFIPPPKPPQQHDLYPYPLALAVILLGLYWLLSLFWVERMTKREATQ